MFYALVNPNGTLQRYPYTLTDLKLDNPSVSFALPISNEAAQAFGVYPVQPAPEPDSDYTVNVSRTAIKQGDQWVEQWISAPATPEEITERTGNQAAVVRSERNQKLANCDWTQLSDAPVDAVPWAAYRQALRDISGQAGFPWDIVWPSEPA